MTMESEGGLLYFGLMGLMALINLASVKQTYDHQA